MNPHQQKIVQYLNEAHASETALIRVLQSQIAMTPRGAYRSALETHLTETKDHARRVERRLGELGRGENPLQAIVGAAESVIGQALALGKTPLDLLRGTNGEEKVLKNAKDAAATEALEIATYTSIERLAEAAGDTRTAELAASIRADEERMLERILGEIPKLTTAVVGGKPFDLSTTGAAEAVKRTVGPRPGADELPIDRYDALTAEQITGRLKRLTQAELAKVEAYERRHENRTTVLERVATLRGDEPWPGYDELNAADVRSALADADPERLRAVRDYERAHKDRSSVLQVAERELTAA